LGLSGRRLRLVGGAAAIGLALCVCLSVEGFRSSAPVGCDPSAGCGKLLSGRWSAWFNLPVSAPACLIYLGMLISSRFVKNEDRDWTLRYAGRLLAMTTALAAASAVWFIILDAAERALCPYCLCLHACGLLAAGLVFQRLRRWPGELLRPVGAGLAILILGQLVVFRQPYRVQADAVSSVPATQPAPLPDRHVRFIAGGRAFDLDPEKLPMLGSPHARHFMIVMSDYTCEHCRVMHRMLERLVNRSGDQIGVIVLPVLLDPQGNPFLPPSVTHPLPQDRALTQMALSVFCAKPAAFAEMNRWLFAEDRVRDESESRAYAGRLIGAAALRSAENDPRNQQITLTGCELFARTGSGMLPKMLIGSAQISGTVEDESVLSPAMKREWAIAP
jgi:uncharacterized membrane protein